MLLYLHTAAGGVVVCVAGTTQGWTSDKKFGNSNLIFRLELVSEHVLNLISCFVCTVHVIRSLNCQYQHMHNFNVID